MISYLSWSYLIWDYFYPTNLLHSGTCGYPSDTRPLNNLQKFTNIINLSVSVHLSGHIAVTAAPRFCYPVGNLPITRRFWPLWTSTFSAAFVWVFSPKQGGCEERLIGPLDEVDRLVGINLGSVYLRRDDAARGANLQRRCYSWRGSNGAYP